MKEPHTDGCMVWNYALQLVIQIRSPLQVAFRFFQRLCIFFSARRSKHNKNQMNLLLSLLLDLSKVWFLSEQKAIIKLDFPHFKHEALIKLNPSKLIRKIRLKCAPLLYQCPQHTMQKRRVRVWSAFLQGIGFTEEGFLQLQKSPAVCVTPFLHAGTLML